MHATTHVEQGLAWLSLPALLLAAPVAGAQEAEIMKSTAAERSVEQTAAVPPIDRQLPDRIETATFALG
jgi:hypothetical protein